MIKFNTKKIILMSAFITLAFCPLFSAKASGYLKITETTTYNIDEKFNFGVNNGATSTAVSIITSGGTGSKQITLNQGSYTVIQDVQTPSGWIFVSASCSNQSGSVGTVGNNGVSSVPITDGQTVYCTFKNSPPTAPAATLSLLATATNNLDGTFNFNIDNVTTSASSKSAVLTTSSGSWLTNIAIDPGKYTITEVDQPGWNVSYVSCGNNIGSVHNNSISGVQISSGQTITCTFQNTPSAILQINKYAVSGDGTFTYNYNINNDSVLPLKSVSITTTGGTGSVQVPIEPGKHTITENDQPGWSMDSNSCSGPFTDDGVATTAEVDPLIGTAPWSNPSRAQSGDDQYATASLSNNSSNQNYSISQYLKLTNFGFNIPSNATIKGIEVEVKRKATNLSNGNVVDNKISIIKEGRVGLVNKAHLLEFWPGDNASVFYGSKNDLWGTVLKPDNVNSPDFGVAFSAGLVKTDNSTAASATANIDSITIKIIYTTTVTVSSGQTLSCNFQNSRTSLKIVQNITGITGVTQSSKYYIFPTPLVVSFPISNNTGSTQVTLDAGIYSIKQVNPTNWSFSGSCNDGTATQTGLSTLSNVTLSSGQPTTCTFNNSPTTTNNTDKGTLKVNLYDDGINGYASSLNFSFHINPTPLVINLGPGSFNVIYDFINNTTTRLPDNSSSLDLYAGSYSINPVLPNGWSVISSTCDNGNYPNFTVSSGTTTTCTFYTTDHGTLTIVSNFPSNYSPIGTTYDISQGSTLIQTTSQSQTSLPLSPGQYSVALNSFGGQVGLPTGWSLASSSCTNGSPSNLTISFGQTNTCTFTYDNNPTPHFSCVNNTCQVDQNGNFSGCTSAGQSCTTPLCPAFECGNGICRRCSSATGCASNCSTPNQACFTPAPPPPPPAPDPDPGYINITVNTTSGDGGFGYIISADNGSTSYPFYYGNSISSLSSLYNQIDPSSSIGITTVNGTGSMKLPIDPKFKYYVKEVIPNLSSGLDYMGSIFDSAFCSSGTPVEAGVKDVVVTSGQTVNCTFNNIFPGKGYLKLTTNATGGNDTFNYNIDGNRRVNIKTINGTGSSGLIIGDLSYINGNIGIFNNILQTPFPSGWQQDSFTCNQYSTTQHTPRKIVNESTGSYGGLTSYISTTDYGFNVPNNAVINNVTVTVNGVDQSQAVESQSIRIVKGGKIRPWARGGVCASWQTFCNIFNNYINSTWNSGLNLNYVYNANQYQNLYPLATNLTPADVNANDFGIAITGIPVPLDKITVGIIYTLPQNITPSIPITNTILVKPGQTLNCFSNVSYSTNNDSNLNFGLNSSKTVKIFNNSTDKQTGDGTFDYNVTPDVVNSSAPSITTKAMETADGSGSIDVKIPYTWYDYYQYYAALVDPAKYIYESAPSTWELKNLSCMLSSTTTHNPGNFKDDSSIGSAAWQNPSDAATANLSNNNNASHYLKVTNFGFNIPKDAVIKGVQVNITKNGTQIDGGVIDNRVSLVKGGTVQSGDRKENTVWQTYDSTSKYGAADDLWGASLSSSDVNADDFGVAISAKLYGDNTNGNTPKASISKVTLTITYETSGSTVDKNAKVISCTFTNSPNICENPDTEPGNRYKFVPELNNL